MPLNDYKCDTCGAIEEVYTPPEVDRAVPCPNGCTEPMRRLPSYFYFKCSARIPKNHIPKSEGGEFDKNNSYWQGMGAKHK